MTTKRNARAQAAHKRAQDDRARHQTVARERGAVLAATARNTDAGDRTAYGISIIEARDLEYPMTIAEQDAHNYLLPGTWRACLAWGWRTYNVKQGDHGAR